MSKVPQGHGFDCYCEDSGCPACVGLRPSHVKATVAGLTMLDTALREPIEDEIPRDKRGSFVEQLGSVKEMVWTQYDQANKRGDRITFMALAMVIEKLDAIASDMALADGKGEGGV